MTHQHDAKLTFPVLLHKDDGSDYGVTVPDLPGCFSAGSTVEEALTMAQEAVALHIAGLIEDGQGIPAARPIEELRWNPDFADGFWAIVTVNLAVSPAA